MLCKRNNPCVLTLLFSEGSFLGQTGLLAVPGSIFSAVSKLLLDKGCFELLKITCGLTNVSKRVDIAESTPAGDFSLLCGEVSAMWENASVCILQFKLLFLSISAQL